MNKFIIKFLVIVFSTISISASAAATISFSVEMSVKNSASSGPEYNEGDEFGTRVPQQNLSCHIDRAYGITFVNCENPEIKSYGIYDVTGGCVAIFGDEESFIDFLFTLSGEYQLRFTTAYYDLVGYIYL